MPFFIRQGCLVVITCAGMLYLDIFHTPPWVRIDINRRNEDRRLVVEISTMYVLQSKQTFRCQGHGNWLSLDVRSNHSPPLGLPGAPFLTAGTSQWPLFFRNATASSHAAISHSTLSVRAIITTSSTYTTHSLFVLLTSPQQSKWLSGKLADIFGICLVSHFGTRCQFHSFDLSFHHVFSLPNIV